MDEKTIPATKRCAKCSAIKPATREFFYTGSRMRDGLHSYCKVCILADKAAERRAQGARVYKLPLAARLWANVDRGASSACWPWQGRLDADGYGHTHIVLRGRKLRRGAHRVAWEITHGPISDGMHVCHKCDNPRCCNPSHMFLGTPRDNVHDCIAKGRFKSYGHPIRRPR